MNEWNQIPNDVRIHQHQDLQVFQVSKTAGAGVLEGVVHCRSRNALYGDRLPCVLF